MLKVKFHFSDNPLVNKLIWVGIGLTVVIAGHFIFQFLVFSLAFLSVGFLLTIVIGAFLYFEYKQKIDQSDIIDIPIVEVVESAETYCSQGNAYADQMKYEEAKIEYTKALDVDPEYSEAYNNFGNIYFKQGLFVAAEQAYKKAIKLSPDYCDAHFNLGILFKSQEKYEEAILKFFEVLQLNPEDDLAKGYIESIKRIIDVRRNDVTP
jgi:tetratricopeptide (TPR) repeat protein